MKAVYDLAIRGLSALESWAMSNKGLPDYLHEDIQTNMEVLERIILETNK